MDGSGLSTSIKTINQKPSTRAHLSRDDSPSIRQQHLDVPTVHRVQVRCDHALDAATKRQLLHINTNRAANGAGTAVHEWQPRPARDGGAKGRQCAGPVTGPRLTGTPTTSLSAIAPSRRFKYSTSRCGTATAPQRQPSPPSPHRQTITTLSRERRARGNCTAR